MDMSLFWFILGALVLILVYVIYVIKVDYRE